MMQTLANLLSPDNPAFRKINQHFTRDGYADPWAFVAVAGCLAAVAGLYGLIRWRRSQKLQPGPHALLKRLADALGLPDRPRRLLWRLTRDSDVEPAAALVCPALLNSLIHDAEQAGWTLTAEERADLAQIVNTVAAAAD